MAPIIILNVPLNIFLNKVNNNGITAGTNIQRAIIPTINNIPLNPVQFIVIPVFSIFFPAIGFKCSFRSSISFKFIFIFSTLVLIASV